MNGLGILIAMMVSENFINCAENTNGQVSYNPAQLLSNIFGTKLTLINNQGDAIKFVDEEQLKEAYEFRQQGAFSNNDLPLIFEDIEHNNPVLPDQNKSKRRRRRRKPKNQVLPGYGNLEYQIPGGLLAANPYLNPEFSAPDGSPGGAFRPPLRPKPSIASEALSAVYGALTSIALYDDQQCVPRLLCEAAGGGTLGSTSLLESVTGLQPLLTLLSAYNGISTSPLFIFGRAVFLGMTSKGNSGTCRYAYPQCPTDPEQLVHYLNNHNGGFFRFFNAPKGQQGVDQFYNQLGSYGLYQNNHLNDQNNFGYGFYKPNQHTKNGLDFHSYGLYKPNKKDQQTYSSTYNHHKFQLDDDDIEKRILNDPTNNFLDDDYEDTKLSFPNNNEDYIYDGDDNIRDVRQFKFPDETSNNIALSSQNNYNDNKIENYKRKGKGFLFPDTDKYTYVNKHKDIHTTNVNGNEYVFDNEHNFYVKKMNDGLRTVYVVRGNGDPNHPEIVQVRPGESVL